MSPDAEPGRPAYVTTDRDIAAIPALNQAMRIGMWSFSGCIFFACHTDGEYGFLDLQGTPGSYSPYGPLVLAPISVFDV